MNLHLVSKTKSLASIKTREGEVPLINCPSTLVKRAVASVIAVIQLLGITIRPAFPPPARAKLMVAGGMEMTDETVAAVVRRRLMA